MQHFFKMSIRTVIIYFVFLQTANVVGAPKRETAINDGDITQGEATPSKMHPMVFLKNNEMTALDSSDFKGIVTPAKDHSKSKHRRMKRVRRSACRAIHAGNVTRSNNATGSGRGKETIHDSTTGSTNSNSVVGLTNTSKCSSGNVTTPGTTSNPNEDNLNLNGRNGGFTLDTNTTDPPSITDASNDTNVTGRGDIATPGDGIDTTTPSDADTATTPPDVEIGTTPPDVDTGTTPPDELSIKGAAGIDPDLLLRNQANSISDSTSTLPPQWPIGNYRIPFSGDQTKCPTTGSFVSNSTIFEELQAFLPSNITLCNSYITKSDSFVDLSLMWQPGQYCIFASDTNSTCPPILSQENIALHRSTRPFISLAFCCSNVTNAKPLVIPSATPFYLLALNGSDCNQVKDMTYTVQSKIISLDNLGISHVTSSHYSPFMNWLTENRPHMIALRYCYYQPILDSSSTDTPEDNINQPTADSKNESKIPIEAIVAPAGAVVVIIGVVVCCCVRKRRLAKSPGLRVNENPIFSLEPSQTVISTKELKPLELGKVLTMILDAETQHTIYKLLIHPEKLEIEDKIGKGAFGTVYYGRYRPDANPLHAQEVAVKTLKDNCGYADINGFMNEALVMADFNHPNVLGLTGVCIKDDSEVPIIVLPFMEHGDLQTYLRHFRYDIDKIDKAPDFPQLLSFCLHVARGMSYLADMKFVHRDLAARNCMLNSNMVAKVADFGLTRDIYCTSYYRQDRNKLLPIKWMAIESLQDRVFTTNSDIWAYGITVWEILTLGKVPYPDQENYQVMGFLENGGRLSKPEICSDGLYELILRCWSETPKSRPPFLDIVKHLEDTLSGLSGYLDLGVDETPQGQPGPPVPTSKRPEFRTFSVETELSHSSADPMLALEERSRPSSYDDYRDSPSPPNNTEDIYGMKLKNT